MFKDEFAVDFYRLVKTKIESREFNGQPVKAKVKKAVLEAARQTGSGINTQHWRFILVQDKENLKRLVSDSTTGKWAATADFAVIILTDPQYNFHMLDAGRAIQSMMLTAWSYNVASGIFTGVELKALQRDFGLPSNLHFAAVAAFGYPKKKIFGIKSRKPLSEIAYLEKYGKELAL
jgi:nitroreductase